MDGLNIHEKASSTETLGTKRNKALTLTNSLEFARLSAILLSGLNALIQIVKVAIELAR